ncbi:AMP-binding protein [Actinoplanes sp. HUAS TT8]|uniref:AMP-binding protein n=1 Tax=Actinoplanes sp. HUAS TT8 TaxID=3447453 RepID=UPI003F523D86
MNRIVRVLRDLAVTEPHRTAIRFTEGSSDTERLITYAQLDRDARAIANLLQRHAAVGSRVLLLHSSGAELAKAFLGCLYGGMVPISAKVPVGAGSHLSWATGVVLDADAPIALHDVASMPDVISWSHQDGLTRVTCLLTEDLPDDADLWTDPETEAPTTALISYRGLRAHEPRGVTIDHETLERLCAQLTESMALRAGDRFGGAFCRSGFGLIIYLLLPLSKGCTAFLLDEDASAGLAEHVARHRIDVSVGSLPQYLSHPAGDGADLTSLRWAGVLDWSGSFREVAGALVRRGAPAGAPTPFHIPSQLPVPLVDLPAGPRIQWRIVHPVTSRECEPGDIGELWVRGDSFKFSYWGKAQESAAFFDARIDGAGPGYCRTGDLVSLQDGELVFHGALADRLCIRKRIYSLSGVLALIRGLDSPLLGSAATAFTLSDDDDGAIVVSEVFSPSRGTAGLPELALEIRRNLQMKVGVALNGVVFVSPGSLQDHRGVLTAALTRELFTATLLDVVYEELDPISRLRCWSPSARIVDPVGAQR